MWVAEEVALRRYPLGKTVTSLVLWLMSWVMWWVSGMSTHGLTGTSMSQSSERTYSKVKIALQFIPPGLWVGGNLSYRTCGKP